MSSITTTPKKQGFFPKVPAISWQAMIILWLVFAINSTCREMLNRVAVPVIDEFHLTAEFFGMCAALMAVANGILSLPGSSWSDKMGQGWARFRSNVVVAAIYIVCTVIIGFPVISSGIYAIIGLLIVRNMAAGIGESVECTTVGEWWPKEARGFALGLHHTGYPWGTFLTGMAIAAVLAASDGNWRLCFMLVAVLAIPVWIIYKIWATPKRFKQYEDVAVSMGLSPGIDSAMAESTGSGKGSIGDCIKNPNILMGALCSFFGISVFWGINFWMSPYLNYIAHYNYAQTAALSVLFCITGGLGQIIWGRISDKIGRKRTLLICFAWLSATLLMLPLIKNGLTYVIIIQLLFGACMNAVFAVMYALVQDSAKPQNIGTAMGLTVLGSGFGAVSTYILGYLIEAGGGWEATVGYQYGIYYLSGLMIAAFLCVLLFCHETVGKRRGKDWAVVTYESCGIDSEKE